MSKHEAEPSIKTELAERLFERVFEAFNPATGITTTFEQEPIA